MKTILLNICFILIFLVSCKDDNSTNTTYPYKSEGVITGFDYRKCGCCGGWFIDINDTTYRFVQIPTSCIGIDLENDTLPIKALLDWKMKASVCGDEITVDRMKRK